MILKNIVKRALFGPEFISDPIRDRFLASYPRSGNTWLRAVLFHYEFGIPAANLAQLDFGIPDQHYAVRRRQLTKFTAGRPRESRIVKTHFPYHTKSGFKSTSYIVRDPRDAIASYYHYKRRRNETDKTLSDFAQAAVLGKIWPGSWYENVRSWLHVGEMEVPHFGWLRYEDLCAAVPGTAAKLAKGLQLSDPSRVEALLAHYDLRMMKKLEGSGNRASEVSDISPFIGAPRDKIEEWETVERVIQSCAPHWFPQIEALGYPKHIKL